MSKSELLLKIKKENEKLKIFEKVMELYSKLITQKQKELEDPLFENEEKNEKELLEYFEAIQEATNHCLDEIFEKTKGVKFFNQGPLSKAHF